MYPEFHPPTFIQQSTHRLGYLRYTQAGGRGDPPGISPGGTARRVVSHPARGHGKRRPGVSEGEDARTCRVVFFVVFRPFVVFVVVQPPPGDPVLGAKQSSSPPGPSTILPALTIFVCISTCSLSLLLKFCTHLSYRCNRTL